MFIQIKFSNFNVKVLLSLLQLLLSGLAKLTHGIEFLMFHLVLWYDRYMYTPLQANLSPWIALVPRFIRFGDKDVTVFTANIVTYSRTLLIIPIAWCLKFNHPISACVLVLFHDFLDHVDGIVAKVQKRIYGNNIDDPLLGGFLDAFCDKVVNIFCLWTILQETNFKQTSTLVTTGFILLCYTIMGLETLIGVVRVQDYFHARFNKNQAACQGSTAAVMEGKLKEKLESTGLAFLCLSTSHAEPFSRWPGIAGIICFALTIRLAYASLMKKLQARQSMVQVEKTQSVESTQETVSSSVLSPVRKNIAILNAFDSSTNVKSRGRASTLDSVLEEKAKRKRVDTQTSHLSSVVGSTSSIVNDPSSPMTSTSINAENPFAGIGNDKQRDNGERRNSNDSSVAQENYSQSVQRSSSLPTMWLDGRADKVYTIGCFDLFHEGHRILLERLRQYGREVIVGVHDSRSIQKLKNRVPVDGTEIRMLNVKRYADQVFCISGTDPSNFVKSIVHLKPNETAVYIRGDDMTDFPSKAVVEKLMPIKFLPYTNGVSSTKLRQELYSHIAANDMEHLDKIN